MKNNMLKTRPILYVATLLLASMLSLPALGQMDDNYRPFQSWDNDNNEKLTVQEFMNGVTETNVFSTWDADDNGSLDKDELNSGIYKKWERSGENFRDKAEARANAWASYYSGTFDDWDLDGDGTITNAEYNEKIGKEKNLQLGEKMDRNKDGRIEEREFYATIFSMWDEENNGYLTEEEYNPDEFESWFL